ncbi:hypothetical protein QQ73_14390, partial [Candidatus Endoriftia persephone str. Guaymas]|nr:hypothetical protein [Candidatus Endoriftia persephone str. Guaymas]
MAWRWSSPACGTFVTDRLYHEEHKAQEEIMANALVFFVPFVVRRCFHDKIHPTAIIEDGAELHPSVSVGPF